MAVNDGHSPYRVVTTFHGRNAVVVLHGRVEKLAAFELSASLDATIDRNPESVVLDLSELEFMGAAGLVAISNAEKRLADLGTELTVRSPSSLINRVVEMMETTRTPLPESASPGAGNLAVVAMGEAPVAPLPAGPDGPRHDLRKITAVPADPDVVDGALRLVVELTRALVGGADGVSVSLLRHGRLSTVAASDHTIMEMDADQYATGEGPCVDASLNGYPFLADSLATDTRWPLFTPRALGLGINSILSSPLKAFEQPIGALNIYSRQASAFEARDQSAAAQFAMKASVILSDAGAWVTDTQMDQRYYEALRTREIITLARGVVMEREGLGEEDAFSSLLRQSLYSGLSLRWRAEAVLASIQRREDELGMGIDA